MLGLPGKYREVVVLYYYQDCSTAEIAQALDLPQGTVSIRLKRARERLKPEGVVLCGVDIRIRPDLIVKVDGAVQSFANEKGEAVYPIVFEEMTYLPVRSIGGPCGKEVTWIAYSGGGEDIYLYAP